MTADQGSGPEPAEFDVNSGDSGVLLSDQIEYYAREHHMIQPFSEKALRPAGYTLHVGDEFMIAGRRYDLQKKGTTDLTIEPYEVAIIKIEEKLCLPRFLIGRWDIRVMLAYQGLMWVGGAHVDPGFKGHLYCPIYNLSNQRVCLRRGSELAMIDFVKTTKFRPPSIEFKSKERSFADYRADQLESALVKQVHEIEEAKAKAETVDARLTTFTTILVSLLGLFGVSRFVSDKEVFMGWPVAFGVVVGLVVLALVVTMLDKRWSTGTISALQSTLRTLRIAPKAVRSEFLWRKRCGVLLVINSCLGLLCLGLLYALLSDSFRPSEGVADVADLNNRVERLEEGVNKLQQYAEDFSEGGSRAGVRR